MSQDNHDQQEEDRAKLWAEADAQDAEGQGQVIDSEIRNDDEAAAAANEVEARGNTSSQTAAAEEVPAANETTFADRYAGLPQEFREEFLGMKELVTSMQQTIRSTNGHIGGLNRELGSVKQQLEAARQMGREAPSAQEIRAAQGSESGMAALLKEYPEFAGHLETAMNERLAGLQEQIQAVRQSQPAPAGVTQEQLQAALDAAEVNRAHPNWNQTILDPVFRGWLSTQPAETVELTKTPGPEAAIEVLNRFAQSRAPRAQTRNSRIPAAAAAIPSGRPAPTARAKDVDQMSPAEQWRYFDEQDRLNTN